ncbi:unnamed protein product [Medioppia subpectinata]|uniref:Carboxylic ester hydrolase n=1 Tax=Medioppia subpectinata TaxID=1979941 RepID=A0A7R9L3S8_9ACAR|nr:unnamed protein product [Medioppia subpectinata]CAG2114772.1 unnamed protein product [Medioppia subpectinata]
MIYIILGFAPNPHLVEQAETDAVTDTFIKLTTSGVVRGQTIDVLNVSIDQFLGIPYAEPPVGRLRFAKPEPIKTPKPPFIDGRVPGKSCVQKYVPQFFFDKVGNITQSEDCLVLNVWTPTVRTGDQLKAALKPVMFWIYGGALFVGSIFQQQYNASLLAAQDVVVVSVRENIHSFGGDKDQITIFGESAGSWSGSAHIISPSSKGLFKRVIMQSGAHYYNPDRDPVNTTEALFMAKQFAKSMNCTDEQKWLDCLRGIDAQALIKGFDTNVQIFPILGTEFLPMSAQQAFKQMSFNKDLDIMAGVERNEGSVLMQPLVIPNPTLQDFTQLVAIVGTVYHNYDIKRIVDFYTKSINTNNSDAILWAEYNFFSDVTMICPTYRFAKAYGQLSGTGSVYFYDQTYARQSYLNETLYGVTHFADIDFVFGLPLLKPSVTDTAIDTRFSLQVMKWWTDFAKYGRPDPKWPKLIGDKPGVKLVSKVKVLNPYKLYYYFEDLFAKTCDDVFSCVH